MTARLARRSLDTGATGQAIAFAERLIAHDACDETAHEIVIRAHLAAGDHPAAVRHFRSYRETLRMELECEPSATLSLLVSA